MTSSLKIQLGDFPGGPVVKNPTFIAGDAGSIPGWGIKIPYAAEQLSPRAAIRVHMGATPEPSRSGVQVSQQEPTRTTAGERPCAARKTQRGKNSFTAGSLWFTNCVSHSFFYFPFSQAWKNKHDNKHRVAGSFAPRPNALTSSSVCP